MNYEVEYKKQIKNNLSKVLKEIKTKSMEIKILNFAEKFGYKFNEIEDKIKNDEIFRCFFAKDPSKQNLYQKLATIFIKNLKIVKEFEVLPSGGKNALYLINGKMFNGETLENRTKDIKSIDFKWKVKDWIFYASHKYTKDTGGAQDNQYRDVQDFLKHTRDSNYEKTIFIAICDGNYYLKKDSSTKDETKILRLKRLTDNKTSFVMTINELEKFLIKYNI